MNNRVVITGLGIWSCLGKNLEEVRNSLYIGKSGIGIDLERKSWGYRSSLTGIVEAPQLKGVIDRRARIGLSEEAEYAYMATAEAMKEAKMDLDWIEKNEVGILYGNDSSAKAVSEAIDTIREKKDTTLLGSGSIFQSMNCTVTMNLSTIFKLKGINFTVSAACASGSHAIGLGYLMIKWGLQKHIICGGAQEVNPFAFGSFDGLSAFSIRESDPTKASRPFDKDRDGLIPSGGAATVILESYESAIQRGAPIIAEVVGYGFSSNGQHISNSSVEGQIRSLDMALTDAKLTPAQIDYINAHATSTPGGDFAEAQAIDRVFGQSKPLVSSTKSMTGHECWMAGASEIVYSTLMMQNNFIAPNINFENPDEASAKLNIAARTQEKNIDLYLSNSFGFGGTNSSLIIKKITNTQ
ncbi:MAG TPA: beta-ketoacyl-[acyl-carrier-protein] synthase family protein [Bacteroidia bacterium]|jgi:3-oxoacyl-[acyl-carrier-protein] synthase-1|nr:beta-ketoacyl-[acyl-carrier-protein] synthase family protein [Bacteroidia bacterium]HRG52918.1 beta-ketoacyl-[acyl-carrier-protein] synthase family protein [Bacteroidia bacterium]